MMMHQQPFLMDPAFSAGMPHHFQQPVQTVYEGQQSTFSHNGMGSAGSSNNSSRASTISPPKCSPLEPSNFNQSQSANLPPRYQPHIGQFLPNNPNIQPENRLAYGPDTFQQDQNNQMQIMNEPTYVTQVSNEQQYVVCQEQAPAFNTSESCGFGRRNKPPAASTANSAHLPAGMAVPPMPQPNRRARSVPTMQPQPHLPESMVQMNGPSMRCQQPQPQMVAVQANEQSPPHMVTMQPVVQYVNVNGSLMQVVPLQNLPAGGIQYVAVEPGSGFMTPQMTPVLMQNASYTGWSSASCSPSRASSVGPNGRSNSHRRSPSNQRNNKKPVEPAVPKFHPEGGIFTAPKRLPGMVDGLTQLCYGAPQGLYIDARVSSWKQPQVVNDEDEERDGENYHCALPLASTAYDPLKQHETLLGERYTVGQVPVKGDTDIRIVSMSGTLELHSMCVDLVPEGDVLIIAGGLTNATCPDPENNPGYIDASRPDMFRDFVHQFLAPVAHKFKLGVYVTLGSHDVWAERNLPEARRIVAEAGARLLVDETATLANGMTIFMSPMSIFRGQENNAFQVVRAGTPGHSKVRKMPNCPRRTDAAYIRTKFPKRPVDILVTHGTPAGSKVGYSVRWQSSLELKNWVGRHQPRVHVFGDSLLNYGAELFNPTARGRGRSRSRVNPVDKSECTITINSSICHANAAKMISEGVRRAPVVLDLPARPLKSSSASPQMRPSQPSPAPQPRAQSVDAKPSQPTSWKQVLMSQQTAAGQRNPDTLSRARRSIIQNPAN